MGVVCLQVETVRHNGVDAEEIEDPPHLTQRIPSQLLEKEDMDGPGKRLKVAAHGGVAEADQDPRLRADSLDHVRDALGPEVGGAGLPPKLAARTRGEEPQVVGLVVHIRVEGAPDPEKKLGSLIGAIQISGWRSR
jgi:hypothetical protein